MPTPLTAPRRPVPSRPAVLAALLLPVATGGCDSEPPGPAPWSVRDSAGIRIVESRWRPQELAEGWSVGSEPTLSIGVLEGAPEEELHQVAGAARLSDGRLAILDAGTDRLRVFGPDGAFLHEVGGPGEGPGEFVDPTLAGRLGDTLLVYDLRLRRLTRVHPDDGPGASIPVPADGGGFPVPRGVLADGTVIFGGGMYFSSADGFPSGVVRTPSPFRSVSPDGRVAARFGEFPGAEMFARVDDGGFMARSLPFGRITVAAASDSLVWIGTADAWQLEVYDPSGRLVRLQRLAAPRRPVTSAMVDALLRDAVEGVDDEDEERALRELWAEMPPADLVPPYDDLVVGRPGSLWVRDHRLPGRERVGWTVFAPAGHAVGRLELPSRWSLLEVGDDELVVRAPDDLGVERVRVYPLVRGSG
ncbi:MAG TPA: 6-bladed beta-propeller [Longimicrobiales bacterium]|nr:6-bladed beta-propeller [Longimicrobiales bacterium]